MGKVKEQAARAKRSYVLDLGEQRGFIRGVTYLTEDSPPQEQCHLFSGVPYALPPVGPFRWRPPRPLPPCYRYGTRTQPGGFDGDGCGLCPQPGYLTSPAPDKWDEDCLQMNIWVPISKPPAGGWPVLFYIHGGWLQFGSPNGNGLQSLLAATSNGANFGAIVVQPAYRLNLFGFLACAELQRESSVSAAGNYGFLDQRLALLWTRNNISYFGGDAGNITVGGLSAGAHSTFHQLAYDLYQPADRQIIRRAFMISNGCGVQPKKIAEAQRQFEALCSNLSIDFKLTDAEKLERLRNVPARELIAASTQEKLPRCHEFRAVSDDVFVRSALFADLESGDFAKRMKDRGVKILTGEVTDERNVYASWRLPLEDNLQALKDRLYADFSRDVVDKTMAVYAPTGQLPNRWGSDCRNWQVDAFGRVYADMQVYALSRGFVSALDAGGAGDLIYRWRIGFRSKNCDLAFPSEWGTTHGTDVVSVWFQGDGLGNGLTGEETQLTKPWVQALSKYVRGEDHIGWGCSGPRTLRVLTKEGETRIEKDADWESGLEIWRAVREAQNAKTAKL